MSNGKGKYTIKKRKMKPGRIESMKKRNFTFEGSEPTGKEGTSDHYKLSTLSRTGTFKRENVHVYKSRPSHGTPPPPKKYKKPRRR